MARYADLPPECKGVPHNKTTPWPSLTLTALLVCVLKFSRSVMWKKKSKQWTSKVNCNLL